MGEYEFVNDKLWKVGRAIMSQKMQGFHRIQYIFAYNGKATYSTSDHDGTKNTKAEDMPLRVRAVMAAVGSKVPLSIFDNQILRQYLYALNDRHSPPHRLERTRIVEVMIDYAMLEFSKIVAERREELGDGIASASIDFWTDPHQKQAFGALIVDIVAFSYTMSGVQSSSAPLFMSKDTAKRLGEKVVRESMLIHSFCTSL